MKNIQWQLNLSSPHLQQTQDPASFRNPLWAKMVFCFTLSSAALLASNPYLLVSLFIVNTASAILFLKKPLSIYKELKNIFVGQTIIICGFYVIKFGFVNGIAPGFLVSLQILCAFLPGVILLKSTSPSQITLVLSRIMPYRLAFILTTSLKFVPTLINEIRDIHEVQLLRGAKVKPRDILYFWNWSDFINCVIVPATIKSMLMAKEIAIAAQARDFGTKKERTFWAGP